MSEIKNLPDGWVETTLGEIAIINPRESISKGTISINIPMECIDSFSKKIQRFYSKSFNGGTKFRNGDTLFARITPCLENGKTAFVDILNENEVGFGSTEYLVFRKIEGKSDKHFIYYLSISPRFREIAIKAMSGTSGRQRVQTDMLINHKFQLPKIAEQKSIASILTSFDDKIELLQSQNKILEEMAQTLFAEWFGKYDVDDDLPEGWGIESLERISNEITRGFTTSYVEKSDLINLNQKVNKGSYLDKQHFKYYDVNTKVPENKFIKKYDILLNSLGEGTLGRVHLYTEETKNVVADQHVSILRFDKSLSFYVYHVLNSTNGQFRLLNEITGSTGMTMLNISKIREFEIVIPTNSILEKFEKVSLSLYEKLEINNSQIQILIKTRDELLPRLMSGEVRVNDFNV